jgi:hypothetical protein
MTFGVQGNETIFGIDGWGRVGINSTSPEGTLHVTSANTGHVTITAQGKSGQTADLFQAKNDTTLVAKIDKNGNLTANNFTGSSSGINTGDQDLSGYATTTALTNGLAGKVDIVTGKGLSTNDLTNTLKSNYDTA